MPPKARKVKRAKRGKGLPNAECLLCKPHTVRPATSISWHLGHVHNIPAGKRIQGVHYEYTSKPLTYRLRKYRKKGVQNVGGQFTTKMLEVSAIIRIPAMFGPIQIVPAGNPVEINL